ncbi:LysR family transcriptional regulator [Vibrio hannami]|uniref:LysR family transcriptional regulator n=1 Tax=Vibrio hannami TaxID=2717094 RepID=UPI00240EB9D2|nr:LysR family transcriptional regulator [Vibrio hannami]MDG3085808.1 LysR family transcriptional regulator [Vibrio hannami]
MQSNLLDGVAVFVEVVNSGSFTHAAAKLGHSTSHISKEINKLEERVGVRLLHRTTRTLRLSPEGEIYYQKCSQIIDDVLEAEEAVAGKQGKPRGVLRVSCPVAFGISKIQPFLGEYLSKFSEIELDIDLNDRKVDLISDGFDVVIRATPQLEDSTMVSRKIMDSASLTLAAPSYLSKHGVPQTPDDLEKHKVINYSNLKNPNLWSYYDENGELIEVRVDGRTKCNNSEMILALATAGQGIVRMPEFNLGNQLKDGQLQVLLEQYGQKTVGVYMVYPSRKHMSSKVRSFIDFFVEKLSKTRP